MSRRSADVPARPWILLAASLLLTSACTSASRFAPSKLREIDTAIETAIAAGKTPGAVFWLEHAGAVHHRAYGNRSVAPALERATEDTMYDAASLTKAVATAPSVWLLIERGRIDLDAPVTRYLPEFNGGWREQVTIRHLLTHTSGISLNVSLREEWSGYDEGVRRAATARVQWRPGMLFRYSDVNSILLGEIVRRISGMPLDRFAREQIFVPLGMLDTTFRPAEVAPAKLARIAPTELTHGVILRGVVHDALARRMGGVAGHAGMFTTASDLARFARAMLSGGAGVWRPGTVRAMTTVQSPACVAGLRAGAFDLDTSYSRPRGDLFPLGSFGHTGFTGGFFWIDPRSRSFYVFLSNRVHPDDSGNVTSLQPLLGTLAAKAAGVTATEPPPPARWIAGGMNVHNGIDTVMADEFEPLSGLRVAVLTDAAATDQSGSPVLDVLASARRVNVVARLGTGRGCASGLPSYDLSAEAARPRTERFRGIDAIVVDLQNSDDLAAALEAVADTGVRMIVLDRTVRDGRTVAGIARTLRDERKLNVELAVVPISTW
ncbi:MAG TPA: serine hydrolase [Thermoanaerobaculia bacterium]|nr:serine hydrolase [Thermoanaerobaculia bacterium]